MDDTGLQPKQVEVNKLCSLKFFGESALIDGEEALQNATVMVLSDRCDLLQLKRSSFLKLMESNEDTFKDRHNNSQSVIDHIKQTKLEQNQSNRNILEGRRNSEVSDSGGVGIKDDDELDGGEEDRGKKVVPLGRPKGLPNLNGVSNNKCSLFN